MGSDSMIAFNAIQGPEVNFPLLIFRFIISIGDNLTSWFTRGSWNIKNPNWVFGIWRPDLDVIAVDYKLLVSLWIVYYTEWWTPLLELFYQKFRLIQYLYLLSDFFILSTIPFVSWIANYPCLYFLVAQSVFHPE